MGKKAKISLTIGLALAFGMAAIGVFALRPKVLPGAASFLSNTRVMSVNRAEAQEVEAYLRSEEFRQKLRTKLIAYPDLIATWTQHNLVFTADIDGLEDVDAVVQAPEYGCVFWTFDGGLCKNYSGGDPNSLQAIQRRIGVWNDEVKATILSEVSKIRTEDLQAWRVAQAKPVKNP